MWDKNRRKGHRDQQRHKEGWGWASAGVTMQKKCQVGFDKWDVLPKNVQLGSEMDSRIKIYLGLEDFSKINGVSR